MVVCNESYKEGDHVRVRSEDAAVRYRKPHLRTPGVLPASAPVPESRPLP